MPGNSRARAIEFKTDGLGVWDLIRGKLGDQNSLINGLSRVVKIGESEYPEWVKKSRVERDALAQRQRAGIGDQAVHVDDLFGAPVSLDFRFHLPGEVVAALPWGPRVRRIRGVQACFYHEPTPRWELDNRTCRSSNLLSDGSVFASLEETSSLLYRLTSS